jgi:hypothetical protein
MLQLHVTDDRGAVTTHQVEHFPFLIGRSPQADLQVASAGVFEQHARLELALEEESAEAKFFLQAIGQSVLLVNGERTNCRRILIGDEISLGGARALVSLSPAGQSALALHESMVWALVCVVVIAEAIVIHLAR